MNFKQIASLSMYFIAIIAFVSIMSGFITGERLQRRGNNEIEQIVFRMYDDIDTGNYEELFQLSFEGRWKKKPEQKKERFYYFDGVVSKEHFLKRAGKDFGKNGWRIRFTSLEIRAIRPFTRPEFADHYPREHEILRHVDASNDITKIYVVEIKGYMVGRCAILDWEKELPIVWTNQKWKALIRGNPADFDIFHREQWFTNIKFNI
ncbi:MAG: hypothetical protein GY797_40865 [Deltaproteobacteria bacterium]|nr:hypothetical protein [Deltaproteobacteria bacterium]